MDASIWVAIITGICTLVGVIVTIRTGNSKTLYRIEQLEKKQDIHNSVIERMYKAEGKIEELQHDVKELKSRK